MEQDKKKKRARTEDDEAEIVGSSFENNNNAKKRDFHHGISFMKDKEKVNSEEGYCWDSHMALGVFDFPWLKDGVVSKYEDLGFEDNFMSSLKHQDTSFKAAAGIDFSDEYGLCEETPEESMAHIPESNLVENVWQPFESNGLELEAEDVDCIWSSLLDKPL